MNDNSKQTITGIELILDILCLVGSYVILFLLPQKTGFFFYLIFGIAAFLFCIGFFRLGFMFDVPAGTKGAFISALVFMVYAVVVNTAGLYGMYQDRGSGRSIVIATLLVIEAQLLISMTGGSITSPGNRWKFGIALRIAAVLMVLGGVGFAVWKDFSTPSVIVGAMLLIEAICLWMMGGGSNPFNQATPEIQTVPGMKTPVGQLQKAFADVETQLGYPWIGKISTIRQDVLIYGPTEDGFVVYGYYQFGRFYVSGSTNELFPKPEEAEKQVVNEVPDENGILMAKEMLPEIYADMFLRYAQTGKAQ